MRWALLIVACVVLAMLAREYFKVPPHHCKIVGDHEIVTGGCIPYCPPKPSECG